MNFLRKKFCRGRCSTVFSLFYRQNAKITSFYCIDDLNHIYSSKKPLSGMNTLRTVLASTVRTVVVVVVVVGGFFNVSP